MMKIDAMTGFALAFAAFAAYQFTRPAPAGTRQASGADAAYGMARRQRDEVGTATSQNAAGLGFFDGTGVFPVSGQDRIADPGWDIGNTPIGRAMSGRPQFFDGTGAYRN